MFLLNWYQQWLEIRIQYRQRRIDVIHDEQVCASCETLRTQLEAVNYEKQRLLDKMLQKPETTERLVAPEPTTPLRPHNIPWAVRRQMLEREDREKARAMTNAPKPDNAVDTADLEKELDVAEQTRETTTNA